MEADNLDATTAMVQLVAPDRSRVATDRVAACDVALGELLLGLQSTLVDPSSVGTRCLPLAAALCVAAAQPDAAPEVGGRRRVRRVRRGVVGAGWRRSETNRSPGTDCMQAAALILDDPSGGKLCDRAVGALRDVARRVACRPGREDSARLLTAWAAEMERSTGPLMADEVTPALSRALRVPRTFMVVNGVLSNPSGKGQAMARLALHAAHDELVDLAALERGAPPAGRKRGRAGASAWGCLPRGAHGRRRWVRATPPCMCPRVQARHSCCHGRARARCFAAGSTTWRRCPPTRWWWWAWTPATPRPGP